jgi:hypothetical protein
MSAGAVVFLSAGVVVFLVVVLVLDFLGSTVEDTL